MYVYMYVFKFWKFWINVVGFFWLIDIVKVIYVLID